jgi:NAD(P)-dependent dehydrogenase (short-subunit alcohol dehydrogenase family)
MSDSNEFKNKTVLVTGATGGIGRGIALGFARAGADVAIHYHSQQSKAEAFASELGSFGVKAAAFQADLTQPDQVERLFAIIQERFGHLDVLVNNAGVYLSSALITEMPAEDWKQMIDADLNSVFLTTQAAGRTMSTQPEGGVILNIASVEGMFPVKGHSYYNASKAGLIMFTRSSAQEFGPKKIRVNTISPGLIWKEGLDQAWPEGVHSWQKNTALGCLGMPEDVAEACLFLASARARWITGANLVVDGGFSARVVY